MLPMGVFFRIGAQSAVGIRYTIFKESKEAVSVSFGILVLLTSRAQKPLTYIINTMLKPCMFLKLTN